MSAQDPTSPAPASGPAIILVAPQLGENIGTAARAMANFGLTDLRLVRPRDGWPSEYAQKAASGADWILDKAKLFDSVEQAVSDLNFVLATTARPRDMVKPVLAPVEAAAEIRARESAGECTGILFGREKSGLTNDHVALSDAVLMAPVNPDFASLNLAQAVLLIAYEWFKPQAQSLGDGRREGGPQEAQGLRMPDTRPAVREEIFGLFGHLETALDESGFLFPPEKRPAMIRNIRNMFHRMAMTEQDVRTFRGIVASLVAGRGPRKPRDD
jgi:tRNA/rRNA methyltransferase